MSLVLNMGSWPKNVRAVTVRDYSEDAKPPTVAFLSKDNEYLVELTMDDFCQVVRYALTNNHLEENDPRLGLIQDLKKARIVPGVVDPADKRIWFPNSFSRPPGYKIPKE